MDYLISGTILLIGLSGITAQVIILRELLVSFFGNELTIGIILANWMIIEAAGVLIIGRIIDRIKNKTNTFITLQIIFCCALLFSVYSARVFKEALGILVGEGMGLVTIFLASFFIILPVSFCHGALFSSSCKILSLNKKEAAAWMGRVYALEVIGTVIGGIVLTYFFIPRLNSFQIAFMIAIANLAVCLFFFKETPRLLKSVVLFALFFLIFFSSGRGLEYLQRASINQQWKGQQVLDYQNSLYGNITLTRKEEQFTFFYNGIPVITVPYPDSIFVQEFANLPLLFHPQPQGLLIIGAGAGGLINEALKEPLKRIDYTELDPLLIQMLRKHPTALTQRELGDPRVKVINLDGRKYLQNTCERYDVILIGLSRPADLSGNRLFTREFFLLARAKLKAGGILAFWLPGSLTYLSQELKDLNACVINSLKDVYRYVRSIPGDYNIYLASDVPDISSVTPGLISQRISERRIKDTVLSPGHLEYRLSRKWQEWFQHSLTGSTEKLNLDFQPFALFETLVIWNKQFSQNIMPIFASLKNLDLKKAAILILFITLILSYFIRRRANLAKLPLAYAIATTGFFGMLTNLLLIFSFQVFFGYLYYKIGILISIFMAGTAAGSIFVTRRIKRIKNAVGLLIKSEAAILVFSFLLAGLISWLGRYQSFLIFSALFFIPGVFLGLEFSLVSKIYVKKKEEVGGAAGVLYFSDLLGGWLAGIFTGVVFLPVLGLWQSCLVAAFFKASSLLLLWIFSKK